MVRLVDPLAKLASLVCFLGISLATPIPDPVEVTVLKAAPRIGNDILASPNWHHLSITQAFPTGSFNPDNFPDGANESAYSYLITPSPHLDFHTGDLTTPTNLPACRRAPQCFPYGLDRVVKWQLHYFLPSFCADPLVRSLPAGSSIYLAQQLWWDKLSLQRFTDERDRRKIVYIGFALEKGAVFDEAVCKESFRELVEGCYRGDVGTSGGRVRGRGVEVVVDVW